MSNVVTEWKKRAKEKFGSVAGGVRKLNSLCGTSIQQGGIDLMEQGSRNIPTCVLRYMIGEVVFGALEEAGWKTASLDLSTKKYLELSDKLSPPPRV